MSTLVKAGGLAGILAGAAMGAMANPHSGLALGAAFGAAIGLFAGRIMAREDERKSARTRELDDIIGTTSGSLGRPSRIPPLPSEEILREAANRRWVAEWMTPVTPRVAELR
ncbi:MAG: hypothetical protein U0270_09335 [Labilithrix sp.]